MFGNDDDGGLDSGDLAGLLFGFLLYREIRDGNIDPGGCLKLGCLVLVGIGAFLGLGLLLFG